MPHFVRRRERKEVKKMIPKFVYKTAYNDITRAYYAGEFTTAEWIERIKALFENFENEYGKNTSMGLGE